MAAATVLLLVAAFAVGTPDWSDCPTPCRCKWASGKKTASCRDGPFVSLPDTLDADMQVLDVTGNSIRHLERAAFQRAGLINLQRIYMRKNRLRDIHPDAFSELIILVEVDLSDNELDELDGGTFSGSERLRVLILSGNPLRELRAAQFPALPHLRTVELERCHLVRIDPAAFVHLSGLESVNLKANRLRNLAETTFMNLAHLKSLTLDGNPWRCDCELRAFRDWYLSSNLRSAALTCSAPPEMLDERWPDVAGERFACAPQVTLSPQPHVQVEAGANVSIACHVLGDPEPEVTWMYDGRPITNHTWLTLEAEEGLLDKWVNISVVNVSDVDAGVYTCVARNAIAAAAANVSLVLPEVVTATTLSKSEGGGRVWWWVASIGGGALVCAVACAVAAVSCVRMRNAQRSRRRRRCRHLKASVSFTEQEKKLLDVSIATTTDRGTERGSCEAIPAEVAAAVPLPMAVYPPPPPEFSGSALPHSAYGNIFISVAVSRDHHTARCPDLLDLPHRVKPLYHGMATLPRRPPHTQHACAAPKYDNMGPRVTAGGSSTLSLPDAAVELAPQTHLVCCAPGRMQTTPDFVSL